MSAADNEPRRLTPTERLHEVTLAFARRAAAEPEHTAEVTRNAKGEYQFSIAVRGYDAAAVVRLAVAQARTLESEFPYGGAA